jgi:arylsulfatase A-like enzyme
MDDARRAVIVVCDSLRRDLITPADAPFLATLAGRAAWFADHRSVFPSTTRASAASLATGCQPARHGLLGNTMALDEGDGLVCLSVGKPDFRDRLHAATGRTLHVPTMAERAARHGRSAIALSNVSPGAAYFLDPDGHGWVYNAAGSYGPGRRPVAPDDHVKVAKGVAGDATMTDRFCDDVLRRRAPALAILWLSEPDYTGHASPLGSPGHRAAIAAADRCVRQIADTVAALDPDGARILLMVGSDHGMETVDRIVDLDGLLIEAGLKRAPGSSDVVVAPQGTAALLYFAEPGGALVGAVARFLETQDWIAECFIGDALATVGLPIDGPAQIALTLARANQSNPHGVRGASAIVRDALEPKECLGFGQHGGLGPHEQQPFLAALGGGFAPGVRRAPSSLIDIAPTVLRHLGLPLDGMDGAPLALSPT